MLEEAQQALAARGLLVLPDFIANAGGVICAAIEYRDGTEGVALALVAEKIRTNTKVVVGEVRRTGALHVWRRYRWPPNGPGRATQTRRRDAPTR
jgi:glutamate dehydrogenase/leucine dehydrogenase